MSKLTGKILSIGQVMVVSEKFQKLEFVIETIEQYPQKIMLQLTQDKVELIKYYSVGKIIDANVNIKGREWINPDGVAKYFITLDVWSMSLSTEDKKTLGNIEQNFEEEAIKDLAEDDDLPF